MFRASLCILICIAVVLMHNIQAQEQRGKYAVLGRVIDSRGHSLPNAKVFLRPPKVITHGDDDLIIMETTDTQGRFRIEGTVIQESLEQKLFVMSPLPSNALQLVSPPFDNLDTTDGTFAGMTVFIKKNQEINVGDVLEQVRYTLVKLQILAPSGLPLLTKPHQWEAVVLRIRDRRGDIIREGRQVYYPMDNKYIDTGKSVIRLSLPEGTWGVEVGLVKAHDRWFALDEMLSIFASKEPVLAIIRVPPAQRRNEAKYIKDVIDKINNPASARRGLEHLGIQYNKKEFVRRALRGNNLAVRLFLLSGMDPNTKDEIGTPALVAAANYPELLEILLNAGAHVNARSSEGATSLMIASANGNISSINLLCSKLAFVNEQTDNGVTALMLAVGGRHYEAVKRLLLLGANPNMKDKNGYSPLKLAESLGENDIASLLRSAGAKI